MGPRMDRRAEAKVRLRKRISRAGNPEAERAQDEVLSLPMFPEITREQIEIVADGVRKFFG